MKTKPRGIHANFQTECAHCRADITVTNGRPAPHECERPITLADIRAALDAK